jgi:hypothetical protein
MQENLHNEAKFLRNRWGFFFLKCYMISHSKRQRSWWSLPWEPLLSLNTHLQSLLWHNRHEIRFLKTIPFCVYSDKTSLRRSGLWRASVLVGMTKPIPKSNADATESMTSPFPFENPENVCRKQKVCERFFNISIVNSVCGSGYCSRYSDSLWAGWSGDRIPLGVRFSAPVQTGPGAHPASYTMGTGSFPGAKWPRRGSDHPPPSSAEINERVNLYLYYSSGSSWPVLGWTFSSEYFPLVL